MLKYYIKIAFKDIFHQKYYSLVIIAGFALSITTWIFFTIWTEEVNNPGNKKEMTELFKIGVYDTEETEFLMDTNMNAHSRLMPETPFPLAPALKNQFSDKIEAARFGYIEKRRVQYGSNSFDEERIAFADPEFFMMFKLKLLYGNTFNHTLQDAADSTYTHIIITESTAKKYFRNENPLGKELIIAGKDSQTGVLESEEKRVWESESRFKIVGVIKNIPIIYKVKFDFLLPITFIRDNEIKSDWVNSRVNTYILIKNAGQKDIRVLINKYLRTRLPFRHGLDEVSSAYPTSLFVKRLPTTNVYSDIRADAGIGSNIQFLNVFYVLSLFIILIACINYFNISHITFANKAREIAIRKTFGAEKKNIIFQILLQAQVLSFISLLFALALVYILLPRFNILASTNISFGVETSRRLVFTVINIVAATIIIGFISGIYPAIYFSIILPSKILSSKIGTGSRRVIFRETMLYIQFTLSIAIFIATLLINKQLKHLRESKGWSGDEYIVKIINSQTGTWEQGLKSPLSQGRTLEHKLNSIMRGILINPNIKLNETNDVETSHGFVSTPNKSTIQLKINSKHFAGSIKYISSVWERYLPKTSFKYIIQDENISEEFGNDRLFLNLFAYFAIVAAFITLLGYSCLALFIAEQRKIEIAIRKTYGASAINIYLMFVEENLLICFSAVISAYLLVAFPVSAWLQRFTDKIGDFNFMEYLLPSFLSMILLIFIISIHSFKAATTKPAVIVKYE